MASKDASFVARREKLEDDLKALQKQIYDFEEAYYAETVGHGNIIKGWDAFMTADVKSSSNARKTKITDEHRVFSRSSVAFKVDSDLPDGADDDYEDTSMGQKRKRLGQFG